MNKPAPGQPLTPDKFTNHPDVVACVNELKTQFGDNYEKLIVSDTIDDQGHQYVHLVQKGGGVLGIALVGYTYILELAGIRFLRMAGTSAGAINTSLLVSIGQKEDAKSSTLLQYLCDLDFFALVDGDWFVRWLIKTFITHKDFTARAKTITMLTAISLLLFVAGDYAFWLLGKKDPSFQPYANFCFTATGLMLLAFTVIALYARYLLNKFKKEGYGLNPGDFFLNWVKARMAENGVNTVTDLNNKAAQLPKLKLRDTAPAANDTSDLFGDITFITSELVSGNKIEFPHMANLFRPNVNDLHPAEFVRASMSIPVFFRSHIIDNIPVNDPVIKAAWEDTFLMGANEIPGTTRFVDGGILSNFPINIFYNPDVLQPRLPAFGIDLDDAKPGGDNGLNAENWSLTEYIGRMFNTIRFYYDKDFLLKNRVFDKGIGKIPLARFNWLNFFLSDDDKMQMFILGAQTATNFLCKFKWDDYSNSHADMQTKLSEKAPQRNRQPVHPR